MRTAFLALLAAVATLFAGASIVLEYHWRRSVASSRVVWIMRIFYYGIAFVLLLMMIAALSGIP